MKKVSIVKILTISMLLIPLFFIACSSDDKNQTDSEQVTEQGETQLWTCGMHPEVILDEPGQCPKCGMNLVPVKQTDDKSAAADTKKNKGKILYWQAPMNPTEIYDKPGKSKMGMDLVPVYEGDVSSGSSVKIDPVTVQNMGVRVAPVERKDFNRTIRTVGVVEYNEETLYTVSPKISGWIDKLYVDFTGKEVRKNQPLLEIYSPELVTTQQEYLLALKNKELVGETQYASILQGAESLLNSTRQRLLYWDIPESEIADLEKRGSVKKNLTLFSPATGVVTHKNAVEGAHIKEGMALYQIADLSKVWIDVSIYDNEAPWIKIGQKAQMELSYQPGKKFDGKVSYIYPYLNEKARDLKVRLEFPNPDLQLRPGMYSNVTIHTDLIPNSIVVPTEAVIRSGQRNIVFVSRDEGRFEPREVIVGEESASRNLRIISGLVGNEKVVVSAQFLLDSESRLQEAIQKMLAEKSETKTAEKETAPDEAMDHDQSTMEKEEESSIEEHNHSAMGSETNKEMENHDHSEMDESDDHKIENLDDKEMKCGDGMNMNKPDKIDKDKSNDHKHENE